MNTDLFSWDSMSQNLAKDAMSTSKFGNNVDERFWKLALDKDSNGGALVRIIPDSENTPLIKMTKINASHGGKQFFVNEWSPSSIALKDPFEEKFSELWKHPKGTDQKDAEGKKWLCPYKQIAKKLGRSQRFIVNIKVIKDPANPDNEGKIFLFDMSPTLFDVVKGAMKPSESEKALGQEAKAVFNPLAGHNFLIKAKMGGNGFVTYTDSKFDENVTSIYDTEAEAVADIKENTHRLKGFYEEDFFLSYEELTEKMNKFLSLDKTYVELFGAAETKTEKSVESTDTDVNASIDTGLDLGATTTEPEPTPKVETKKDTSTDDLDDLLADLG